MKDLVIRSAVVAAVLVFAACSHSAPNPDFATPLALEANGRWTANIKPATQDRLSARDSTGGRSFGAAEWVQGKTPTTSSVFITFTYAGAEHDLSWAILFGACSSASLPVAPISNFPEIDVSTNGGRGQASVSLSVELPTSGEYHIDVYKDRLGGLESVVGCGNMRHTQR